MSERMKIAAVLERVNSLFEQVMVIELPTDETAVNARPVMSNRAIMRIKALLLLVVECQAILAGHIQNCERSPDVGKAERNRGS